MSEESLLRELVSVSEEPSFLLLPCNSNWLPLLNTLLTHSTKPVSIIVITHYEHTYDALYVVLVLAQVYPDLAYNVIIQHYRHIISHCKYGDNAV